MVEITCKRPTKFINIGSNNSTQLYAQYYLYFRLVVNENSFPKYSMTHKLETHLNFEE